ncbi:MAG: TRAP transporter substrate-binding protein DctP [Desulfocapsaceae bacterium]|jgi:TRAP-type C4-dicarboxylate transport system substrate-binding protein|nr:TRAP transporter substrate-binding protein DctP [Desulfocapsaceae bacterium]
MNQKISLAVVVILALFLSLQESSASSRHTFKIASLAPEGSVWVNSFKDFAEEVNSNTNGEIAFRIYPGGVMGDDRAMYRKMRVGQLHGGGFTMTGIAEIVPDFRVMAIPFLFHSYAEVDAASADLQPLFRQRFAAEGLQLVAMTEVGFIYTFSTRPQVSVADLQQSKVWAPPEDPLTAAFLSELQISPITLSIPDVLSSLQTGLIDTAFNSLYGSIVLQWFTKASYVTDQPYGYAYGAFIMSDRAMAKLSEEQRTIIEKAAEKFFPELIEKTRQSNQDSRDVLSKQGVSFVETTEEVIATLEEQRDRAIARVRGTSFSEEAYQILKSAIARHRAGGN